jgi:magnesium chelatase family protein
VIDSLRQPLEERIINISRASFHASYPADFQLVAAMNPCRCGFMGNKERECHKAPRCGVDYQSKISGPFLDRIDMYLEINAQKIDEMINQEQGESSRAIALRVAKSKLIQEKRYQGTLIKNCHLFA